jgi:predicted O-methyltransferase YrrM
MTDDTSQPAADISFEQILRQVDHVNGWMSPDQAAVLHRSAADCPEHGSIVEIGSFQGRSTIVLALSASAGTSVVAIDPHAGNDRGPQEIDGFEHQAADDHTIFLANLAAAGVADRVRHIRSFSDDALGAVTGPIDVLYIDGAHRYGPAQRDIRAWGSRVTDGGTLLIHDSFSSLGVTAAIARHLFAGGDFRFVGRARSLAIFRRDLRPTFKARVVNAWHVLGQLPWFVRNLALKVLLTLGLGKVCAKLGRPVPEWPY